MNRDHMRLQAVELEYAHKAFSAILPEVAIDGHEFTYWSGNGSGTSARMGNAYDIESTPASSLNNNAKVNAFAMNQISTRLHEKLSGVGLRNYHYGYTVNNPIGRAYMGLFNAISILVETRGIGAGKQNFERRVFSQVTAAKSITETSALYAQQIRDMVAEARAEVIAKGAVYDDDDDLVLYHTASGNTQTPFALMQSVSYNMDGTLNSAGTAVTLSMNDTIAHSRPRPTAYILPKDVSADLLDLELALYITKSQGAEIFELPAGAVVPVQQYYYTSDWHTDSGVTTPHVDLHAETEVTFPAGAYVIPMDQVCGNVLGMLYEPDVRDSGGYNGTLAQSEILKYDATTKDYPLYRYIVNDPREALGLNPEETPGGTGGSGSSSGCNSLGLGALAALGILGILYRGNSRKD